MATLVLTAVGTALGGPLGGALGGLVGQSIDQGLFGSGTRRGPRLGDLTVQTSSYGSAIPRIYGRMRVAGTVVWATDLKEEEAIAGGGKGSPEQIGYRYSVSLAVALSSRPIRAVRRIWADGKLIRGAGGEFTVRTGFRAISGSEDQTVDPMIASIESIERTPAYRGLALAIFEDFELGEFGNRIPLLTFEVEADDAAISLGRLLGDASGGLVDLPETQAIAGFAAHGSSIGDSIRPLIELTGMPLAERDGKLRGSASSVPVQLESEELGCDADGRAQPRVEHLRAAQSSLPASQSLVYYDPGRDFQAGQMRASSGGAGAIDDRIELPAVLAAEEAKRWVEQGLARRWQSATKVRLRLPPSRIGLRPGDHLQLPDSQRPVTIGRLEIDGMSVVVEAETAPAEVASLPADPGRVISDPDIPVGRSELALFETPSWSDAPESAARLFAAASNQGKWKPLPFELRLGTEPIADQAAARRAVLGSTETALEPRSPMILDLLSSVTVRLVNSDQWLINADPDALTAGANLAIVGDELIQFGRAEQLSPGLFRLSRLLRGRRGTEWAVSTHVEGEHFCLFDPATLETIELPGGAVGAELKATAYGVGDVPPLPEARRAVSGEAMRPPPVCHLNAWRDGSVLKLSWVRRTYRGWSWIDGVEVGGDSFPESYRLTIIGPAGQLTMEADILFANLDVALLPAATGEEIDIQLQTIGPMALSRVRTVSFTI